MYFFFLSSGRGDEFLYIVNQKKITQKIHFRWILTLIPHLTWKLRARVK